MLDVLENQRWCDIARITDLVIEWDGIWCSLHCFKAHNLSSYFLFLDRFQHFYHNSLIAQKVNCLKNFRVPTPANFADYLIIVLPIEMDRGVCIVTIPWILLFVSDLFYSVSIVLGQLICANLYLCWTQTGHFCQR